MKRSLSTWWVLVFAQKLPWEKNYAAWRKGTYFRYLICKLYCKYSNYTIVPLFLVHGTRAHLTLRATRSDAEIAKMQRASWPLFSWCLSVCLSVGPPREARAKRSAECIGGHYFRSSTLWVCLSVQTISPKRLDRSRWNLAYVLRACLGSAPYQESAFRYSVSMATAKNSIFGRQWALWAPFSQ